MAKMRPRCGRETYVATFLCARLFTQANTAAFCKGLRNFLRGPTDDAVYRSELLEMAEAGLIPRRQVDACMAAKNRPMFCLSAMSHNIRQVMLDGSQRGLLSADVSADVSAASPPVRRSSTPCRARAWTSRWLCWST